MALKPRIVRTEEQKPAVERVEGQQGDPSAKPRVVKTEKVKPKKPAAEK